MTLHLTDEYKVRNEILAQLLKHTNSWFQLALARAPVELQATLQVYSSNSSSIKQFSIPLQKYLAVNQCFFGSDTADLGATIAEQYGKSIGATSRHLGSFAFVLFMIPV